MTGNSTAEQPTSEGHPVIQRVVRPAGARHSGAWRNTVEPDAVAQVSDPTGARRWPIVALVGLSLFAVLVGGTLALLLSSLARPAAGSPAGREAGIVIPYVLSNYSHYVDPTNRLHIVGEIFNPTAQGLLYPRTDVTFFDATGGVVDTGYTYTYLENLPANDKTCFHIVQPQPAGWTSYRFSLVDYRLDGRALPRLTVLGSSGAEQPTRSAYEIEGRIRNDDSRRVAYANVVATLYNTAGLVVGCNLAFLTSTHLNTGQTSVFGVLFAGRNYADVASHRIQADGG